MNDDYQKSLWNEFDWEKELRKDDERIHTYMSELPRYIDLPDEDGIIMKQIQRHPELVPHGGKWPDSPIPGSGLEDGEDDESLFLGGDWQKYDGAEVYTLAGKLSYELCLLFSETKNDAGTKLFMRSLCSAGKIMARSCDVMDLQTTEWHTLRIALAKRMLSDVNSIMGDMMQLCENENSDEREIESVLETSHLLRERILALIGRLRNPESEKNSEQEREED